MLWAAIPTLTLPKQRLGQRIGAALVSQTLSLSSPTHPHRPFPTPHLTSYGRADVYYHRHSQTQSVRMPYVELTIRHACLAYGALFGPLLGAVFGALGFRVWSLVWCCIFGCIWSSLWCSTNEKMMSQTPRDINTICSIWCSTRHQPHMLYLVLYLVLYVVLY